MNAIANVAIDASQFPDNVRRDLLVSLRMRQINHKFHYDSVKQAQKWLALHEAHSPARHDKDCLATYDRAFAETSEAMASKQIHVIGLGCGGGQKDVRLLKSLKARAKKISYTPCDVSTALVLVARGAALKILPEKNCFPLVCDLVTASDLPAKLAIRHPSLVTFFGMIPNFEPQQILPKLAALIRKGDFLLFSANLAPGDDYAAGVKRVLPQYDNILMRDWLMTFLSDLGVRARDGKMKFSIETGDLKLKRIAAHFHFQRSVRLKLDDMSFGFQRGESIRLFFSYRYTSKLARKVLSRHGLEVSHQWITRSGEEGVFLCRKK